MANINFIALLAMDEMDQAEELLKNGRVNINARDASGRTALDYVLLPRLLEPSYSCYDEEGWQHAYFVCVREFLFYC